MKKVFMSTLMLLVAVMISAATYSWEKVVTVTLTDGNNDTYSSRFGAAPELTDAASWGAVSANLTGATVRAYTTLGGVDYEQLYLNSIENLPLTVKTYNSANMTFTLTAIYGEIKLFDNGNLVLTVAKGGVETDSYECTVETNTTIADRFVINYVAPAPVYAAEVTTNANGLATFSYASDLEAVENDVKLYKGDLNGNELVLSGVNYVKANQGVIVYGAANTTYHFNVGTGTSDFTGNELLPASAWDYAAQDGYSIYVLSGNMLYLYEGDQMKPNKAFLKVQNPISGNAPARISMRFNGTQDVENAEAEDAKAVKFVENGEIFIRRGNEVYNLQGQIVK